MAASLIGCQLGQYQVVAELGRGQHSIVYKAWQQSLERYVALKVLHRCDARTRKKLQEEALLTADLIQRGAANIRQIYEVGQTADGFLFVAQEYVDGSLRNIMDRARRERKLMNPAAAARLLMPVAQALDAVHSMGLVHLDLKPQNILISRMGRTLLADFGIAQRRGMRTHACTPIYASPEQADGDRPVGPWSDIYSLGVILYEMVTGRPPFRGDLDLVVLNKHLTEDPLPPRKINPSISATQERAILKALNKSPADRPRAASELLQALLPSANLISTALALPSQMLERTSIWTRRVPRPLMAAILIVLLVVVLSLAGWTVWPHLPFHSPGGPAATDTATTVLSTTVAPATATPRPTITRTPPRTTVPTSTLAPTPTRTPRPVPTRTRSPTPPPAENATASPG